MSSAENLLILKLDKFIRRYYKNQLIRGLLYSAAILLVTFLAVTLIEYFGQFSQPVRTILFFGFILSTAFVIGRFIIIPLLKLYRIGAIISYDEAARIIGVHFANVQDKLLNVLQLRSRRAVHASDELLLAGIDQKIGELDPVPFFAAVDLSQNRRYLRYVLPPLAFTLLIAVLWPHVLTRSTERLVNYDVYYEKELPFRFFIRNEKLTALQASDFNLEIGVSGNQVPNEAYIEMNGIEYRLEKKNPVTFSYNLSNLQKDVRFRIAAAGYYTGEYEIRVLPRATLQNFSVQLLFPAYLKRPAERLSNVGDLQVPEGTKAIWTFSTRNTNSLQVKFADTLLVPPQVAANEFSFFRTFFRSDRYTLYPLNEHVTGTFDSVTYAVNVVPDRAPEIDLNATADSLQAGYTYFSGTIKDDYGFTSLRFHYRRMATDSAGKMQESAGSIALPLDPSKISQPYFHYFDAAQFELGAGDKVEYYFEVHDNDGVHGPKSSRTRLFTFKAPSRDEIRATTDKNNQDIKSDLEQSIKKAAQLQKEISTISKKINDKQRLGYEEKKSLEDLIKKQQELQQKVDEIRRQNENNNKQQSEYSPLDESILEKQQQLQELFENVMTPEMKKLFDELNKMLEKLDKAEVQEKLDELKLTNKDIEKELDRNLEAFRQLEMQQKMQEAIEKLAELKETQDQLREKTEDVQKAGKEKDRKGEKDGKESAEDLKKDQEQLKEDFEQLRKQLDEVEQKNKALEEPLALPKTENTEQQISQEMQKSTEQLDKGNRKNASDSQKSASEKMQEMMDQMEQAMAEQEEEQQEENAQALRQILENLLNMSFSQEELIRQLKEVRIDNPRYTDIPKGQNKLKDDARIIEDSLLALSKRAPQINAIVNREISNINMNMEKTVKNLADRNTGESAMRMQSTMKSVNDLAVLLNESLEQMQNQMKMKKNSKGGKGGACKKPGSGGGENSSKQTKPLSNLRQMQEQLNKQLKELKDALEKGQKPGEKPGEKPGQKPGGKLPGGSGLPMTPGSSEQFARMAARQEALRRQMEELMQKIKSKGGQPGGNLADLMEQTEKDLVNKRLTNETMKRQQDILSRLLESEKAEREREQDEQRKSTESKAEFSGNPERFLEYKRLKEKEMELLITVPPSLTPFYKEKVNQYFNQLNGK